MKRIVFPLALCLASCISVPTLDDLKEDSYPSVVQLLTEDDNETVMHRLDRYNLDVVITFRGKEYEKYTVTFYGDEE